MMKQFALAFSLLCSVALGQAQTFEAAAASAKSDLDKALAELSALEKKIANEKIPLARELNTLESEVIAKRREHTEARRLQDRKSVDLSKLKAEEKAFTEQNDYLRKTLLEEYIRRFETRIHASEKEQYQSVVRTARETNDNPSSPVESVFTGQLTVVQAALDRLGNLLGGHVYDGTALNAEGIAERGKFAALGPLVVFAVSDSEAGLAEQLRGSTDATLVDIGPEHHAGIVAVTGSGTGLVPFDSTMGNALKIKQVQETWWEHINKGGVVIWPLLGLGLAAALVALIKWAQLARLQQVRPGDLQSILDRVNDNDPASASGLGQAHPGTRRRTTADSHPKHRREQGNDRGNSLRENAARQAEAGEHAAVHLAGGSDGAAAGPARHGDRHDQHFQADHRIRHRRSQAALLRHLGGTGDHRVRPDHRRAMSAAVCAAVTQVQGHPGQHGADSGRFHKRLDGKKRTLIDGRHSRVHR